MITEKMTDKYDITVIGGGASGMVAAGVAANRGRSVLLIERNKFLGRKLRITGKGRCNITNIADNSEFFNNITVNPKFLYSSFYDFNNYSVIDFFNALGVETKVERGGRVFPVSDKAVDVVNALIRFVDNAGVKVVNERVIKILKTDCGFSVFTDNKMFSSEKVIIATGGMSYPLTGSTGDGYRFAQKFGHTVVPLKPSLVSIKIKEKFCGEMQGLSLKNVRVTLYKDSKAIFSNMGEMIFTHDGVSGPIILSASSHIKSDANYSLVLDLKPALSEKQLDARVLRDFSKYINKQFSNSLSELLPKKMIQTIIQLSGIPSDKKINNITREERSLLVNTIKNINMSVSGLGPIEEAIITSGGIKTSEISPSTMESKLVSGLYFCGEIIDVDAYTGGYNLQIAFSTGHLAGASAAE